MLKECLNKLNISLEWYSPLYEGFKKYNLIDKEKIIKIFLAQTSHESNNYQRLEESFNYTPKRLLEVFGKRIGSIENANSLCKEGKEAIANFVYGGRLGNLKDEGYKYRGRGIIQLTGKNNYERFSKYLNIDLVNNPNILITDKNIIVEVALAFFKLNKLFDINDIEKSTKIINGGLNGLSDRIKRYEKIKDIY